MAFYKTERLALFIDGANLYSAGKTLGVEVDYRKLLDEFRRRGQLVRAYYYTALIENEDYSPIRPLVDWLQYNGFKVVTKPAKEFTDSTGRRRVKGDMDVEIAVDMLNLCQACRPCRPLLGRWGFDPAGRGGAGKGRSGVGGVVGEDVAADDRRRTAPRRGHLHRAGGPRRARGTSSAAAGDADGLGRRRRR